MAPSLAAMMQMRSHSMEAVKMAEPPPSLPSRFVTGTSTSTRASSAMGEVRKPILWSFLLMENPGVPLSTMKADTPAFPFEGSRLAKTITMSAMGALVMKVLLPLIT